MSGAIAAGMKPLVALDLEPLSLGALRFARWLAGDAEDLLCVHILRNDYVRHAVAYRSLSEVMSRAEHSCQEVVQRAQIPGNTRVEVRRAQEIAEGLWAAQQELGADLLVIGRNAKTEGAALIRLGSVARRVIRRATAPVCVVPPDLREVGGGPIVLATACDEASSRSARYARELAQRTGRALVAVHVVPPLDAYLQTHLPPKAMASIQAEELEDGRRRLSEWGAKCGLAPEALHLLEGEVVNQVGTFARARDAAVVVCAPKERNLLERLVVESASTALAAHASSPVLLVPS